MKLPPTSAMGILHYSQNWAVHFSRLDLAGNRRSQNLLKTLRHNKPSRLCKNKSAINFLVVWAKYWEMAAVETPKSQIKIISLAKSLPTLFGVHLKGYLAANSA